MKSELIAEFRKGILNSVKGKDLSTPQKKRLNRAINTLAENVFGDSDVNSILVENAKSTIASTLDITKNKSIDKIKETAINALAKVLISL